jgi:hypothetical protein
LLTILSNVYVETRYPGELGLLPDGRPTLKQVADFLILAKEIGTRAREVV